MHLMMLIDKIKALPKLVKIGLVGVLLTYVGITSVYALTIQWFGTGDSPLHLDYVWQVTQGKLPNFEESVLYEPINAIREHDVHYVSQHPPLFYVILAPFLTIFLEGDNWKHAMLTGRVINIGIGILLGLSLAWSGWLFGGKRKQLFIVATPFIGLTSMLVVRNSADVLNDTLALLFTVLALNLSYKIIRDGTTAKSLALLSATLTLGMSTRASFIATLIISLLAVAISIFIYGNKKTLLNKSLKTLKMCTAVVIPIVITIGWFYWRNYQASGSWARSGAQSWIADIRPYKTLIDVLMNQNLYTAPLKIFHTHYLWPFAATATLIGIFKVYTLNLKGAVSRDKFTISIFILLLTYIALVYGMQIEHAVGYGQFSERYFISLLMPITIILIYGLTAINKLRGQAIIIFGTVSLIGVAIGIKSFLDTKVAPHLYETLGLIESLKLASNQNGVPFILVIFGSILCLVGLTITSIVVYRLSSKSKPTNRQQIQ